MASANAFQIVADRRSAKIFVDPQDWKGVIRAANDLGDDVRKVSGTGAEVIQSVGFTNEADRVLKHWQDLVAKAETIQRKIAPEAKDAYYQLVLYPAKA